MKQYRELIKKFIIPVLIGFIVGALADVVAQWDKSANTSSFAIGFFVIIPVLILLLQLIFSFFKVKSEAGVLMIIITTFSFFFAMIFGFWFYDFRVGGYSSDMYSLIYILGIVPSLVVGLSFGIYLRYIWRTVGKI